MKREDILFWVAILGFFGITGAQLINTISQFINNLYLQLGGLIWVIFIGLLYLLLNWNK